MLGVLDSMKLERDRDRYSQHIKTLKRNQKIIGETRRDFKD
jgi:hypothetical protein